MRPFVHLPVRKTTLPVSRVAPFGQATHYAVFWVLVYMFFVPILVWVVYRSVRLMWLLLRIVVISTLRLIHLAGREWRNSQALRNRSVPARNRS
jgi:hypothetical protein